MSCLWLAAQPGRQDLTSFSHLKASFYRICTALPDTHPLVCADMDGCKTLSRTDMEVSVSAQDL